MLDLAGPALVGMLGGPRPAKHATGAPLARARSASGGSFYAGNRAAYAPRWFAHHSPGCLIPPSPHLIASRFPPSCSQNLADTQMAGLVPFGDWVCGWAGGPLHGENSFYDLVEAHVDKPLRLYVYSADLE